jgi:hypothetical protein
MGQERNIELPTPRISIPEFPQRDGNGSSTFPRLAFSLRETAHMLGVNERAIPAADRAAANPSLESTAHIRIPKQKIERFLQDTDPLNK